MFNVKKCNFDITVGNQETTKCTKMGDIRLKLENSTAKECNSYFVQFQIRTTFYWEPIQYIYSNVKWS